MTAPNMRLYPETSGKNISTLPWQEKPSRLYEMNREDTEWQYADEHMRYVRKLPISSTDVILVAIPMREISWLEVIDAAIFAGAEFILVDEDQTPAQLAEQAVRQNASIIAATGQMWKNICVQLTANFREQKSLCGIVLGKNSKLMVDYYPYKN